MSPASDPTILLFSVVSGRPAFRELGLATGLHAVECMRQAAEAGQAALSPEAQALIQALLRYAPIGQAIEAFWLDPGHQKAST